ncbi:hypothetical protein JTB14_023236 [Gonioctena quinquepunctata]|nr:hypothetical protein JTB14_023236 [Gonioctena quinquepunctata]
MPWESLFRPVWKEISTEPTTASKSRYARIVKRRSRLSHHTESLLVSECIDDLQRLSIANKVNLLWVPRHTGVPGQRAKSSTIGPEPILGISRSWSVSTMKGILEVKFQEAWKKALGMRQSKLHLEGLSTKWCDLQSDAHVMASALKLTDGYFKLTRV